VLTREEDVTSAVRSSERRTAILVVIRRVVLLVSFLLTGFAIALCWSATASAAESGADEAPRSMHDRLLATVSKNETGAVDAVHTLVDVAETVDRVDEISELTLVIADVVDAMGPNSVDDVATVTDLVRDAPGDLVTMIETAADRGIAYEMPSPSLLQAVPDSPVVERGWSSAEVAPSTIVPSPRVDIAPTVHSRSAHKDTGANAPVDHFYGNDLSSQFPTGFPVAPFSAAGTSGGASAVGSSCGTAGAIAPGNTCHDDVFVVNGIAAESVHPVRQLALVPQVSPA
jgi:hypothetical protein